jgi:hypothetical protein
MGYPAGGYGIGGGTMSDLPSRAGWLPVGCASLGPWCRRVIAVGTAGGEVVPGDAKRPVVRLVGSDRCSAAITEQVNRCGVVGAAAGAGNRRVRAPLLGVQWSGGAAVVAAAVDAGHAGERDCLGQGPRGEVRRRGSEGRFSLDQQT